MKVMIALDGVWRNLDCSELDVVRLVASTRNIDDIDVEILPEKASIRSKTITAHGGTLDDACETFLRRAFG